MDTEKIQRYDLIARKNEESTKGTPDEGLIKLINSLQKKLIAEKITLGEFTVQIINAYPGTKKPGSSEDTPEPKVGLHTKSPLVVVACYTPRAFFWMAKEGPQSLDKGGYVLFSAHWDKEQKKFIFDVWGVGDEFMEKSYLFDDSIKTSAIYKRVLGLKVEDLTKRIPELEGKFQLGDVKSDKVGKPFRVTLKTASVLAFMAGADYDLWTMESLAEGGKPQQVKKGEPILIGVEGEMWKRDIEIFKQQYVQIDTLLVDKQEIVSFIEQSALGLMSQESLAAWGSELIIRIKNFGFRIEGDGTPHIPGALELAKYASATTTSLNAVVVPDVVTADDHLAMNQAIDRQTVEVPAVKDADLWVEGGNGQKYMKPE